MAQSSWVLIEECSALHRQWVNSNKCSGVFLNTQKCADKENNYITCQVTANFKGYEWQYAITGLDWCEMTSSPLMCYSGKKLTTSLAWTHRQSQCRLLLTAHTVQYPCCDLWSPITPSLKAKGEGIHTHVHFYANPPAQSTSPTIVHHQL